MFTIKERTLLVLLLLVVPFSKIHAQDTTRFFPEGHLREFSEKWYSKHLKAMKEPSFRDRYTGTTTEAYRLLHLPTWDKPFAIRIEKKGDDIHTYAVRLSGAGGYDPRTIALERTLLRTSDYWTEIKSGISKIDFWNMDTEQDFRGTDGRETIIEGRKDGKYHVIIRWSPGYDTEKRNLKDYLTFFDSTLKTAGIPQTPPEKENN